MVCPPSTAITAPVTCDHTTVADTTLRRAGAAATALQTDTDWSTIAETTYNFIEGLVVDH